MNKILLVGPIFPPMHGQSLAFTRLHESIDEKYKFVINTNFEGMGFSKKILGTLRCLILIVYRIIFFRVGLVYFTCSRSFMGSIKDVFLINIADWKGVKLVNHLHGSDFYDFISESSAWYRWVLLKSYDKVDTSIVLLESMRLQFVDFPSMNIEVVANFYDSSLDDIEIIPDSGRVNMLYLSNVIKSKGIFELIEAFHVLSKCYDNLYLNVAGDFVSDESMNENDVKELFFKSIGNNENIKYVGVVYGKEKMRLLQKSDLFVLPSYYKSEAFPISIIEAMRCGNAIVASNYKYLPDIVNDNNGVTVEIKSSKSIRNGVMRLIEDMDKLTRIKLYNMNYAKRNYSLSEYQTKMNEILFR